MFTPEVFMALQKQVEALTQQIKAHKLPPHREVSPEDPTDEEEEEVDSQKYDNLKTEARVIAPAKASVRASPKNVSTWTSSP